MNEPIRGVCVDYTHDGRGIIKHEGKPIFIDGLFIDEEASVEITYQRKDYAVAKIVKLHSLSPDRIQPRCPVATACGGCAFQALSYQAQLDFKKRKVSEALRKIGGISMDIEDVVGMEEPYFYRNKTQMPFGYDKQNRLVSGFYRRNSHTIVPIEKCYIEDERSAPIINTIRRLMIELKIPAYDEDNRKGIIRHVLVKTSRAFAQIMVVLVTNADSFPARGQLIQALRAAHSEITTIVQNINTRDTNVILGQKENVLFGKGYIKDKLNDLIFNISSKSFYQVNSIQAERLYNLAIEKAEIKEDETVLDAYCGIGTISLIASKFAKQVYGVEVVKESVDDAKKNARANNINNVSFYATKAEDFIDELIKSNIQINVVIVDPPRKGLEEKFITSLLKLAPSRIIYISCEPSTLARDIGIIKKKYEIKTVTPVDMFPQTYHVESITLLSLK